MLISKKVYFIHFGFDFSATFGFDFSATFGYLNFGFNSQYSKKVT